MAEFDVLQRSVLADLPLGVPMSMERDVFPALAGGNGGGVLATAQFDGWFTDIGVPDDYAALAGDPTPILAALAAASPC